VVSAATLQKLETAPTPATINSSDKIDVLTKGKNEEDDCIDEEFGKESPA
jgi:hypothetical protein